MPLSRCRYATSVLRGGGKKARFGGKGRSRAYHLDLEQRFIAVVEQISRLAPVDSDDAEKQLPAQAQSHWRRRLVDHDLDAVFQVRRDAFLLGELALHIGREPDAGQRPRLGEQRVRVEHGDAVVVMDGASCPASAGCRAVSRSRKRVC
jgi:hypothetical protein